MSDRTVKIGLFVLILLNIIDLISTIAFVNLGVAKEVNPLMKYFLDHGVLYFTLVKLTAIALSTYIFWQYRRRKFTAVALGICILGYSILMAHLGTQVAQL
tara:strand:- start:994 stop:1296 length:303 start_codon:yes stop_codon:yes gene_type:complete